MNIKQFTTKLFWSEGHDDVIMSSADSATFCVNLNKLLVGTLEYYDSKWHFSYSDQFKSQNKISPLTNFPSKDKEYVSEELWPFFSSRIPSNAQLQISDDKREKESIVDLLKKHGKKTITNPYELLYTV
jgi:HipA-like protein